MELAKSRLIPPICLSWRSLISAVGGSLGKSLIEVAAMLFLLVLLLFRMPKFTLAVV